MTIMTEQPVFTSRAHVFFIEPNSGKKEWTPAGAAEGSVPVDICYDHTRHNYKVTSIVDSKPVFSSALSPDYTFIKTSHKFGQWLDTSNGVLYGLGFANETELSNFSKKFNQYKEESTPPPPVTNNNRYSQSNGPLPNSDEEPITLDNGKQYQSLYSASSPFKDLDASPIMDRKHPNEAGVGNKPKQGRHRLHELDGDLNDHSDEAERLKLEWEKSQHQLNQLSRENKRKEEEIEGLRRNNVKLTSAMRESAANVEEWKKLLHKYREDSLEAKNKFHALYATGPSYYIAEMEAKQKEREEQLRLSALEDEKIQSLQKELQEKDREIAILNKELLTTQNDNNRLQMDNNRLRSQLDQMREELNNKSENEGKKKKEQQEMASQMNSKIQELQLMNATLQSKL
ncbi:homer protein homolog 2-like isoform X2 [Symsagittifera roscoffensis]|uniref:homer protein homolog 2-like isoform X2 n=1 Tax=Symsagittifera roscoffensis TaxID=84072 RepID=UPI00307BAA51